MVEPPFVLGHEPGGVVVEVGEDVTHLKVATELHWNREKPADTVNSVRKENIICVRMLYSLQHHRLMEYFRSM